MLTVVGDPFEFHRSGMALEMPLGPIVSLLYEEDLKAVYSANQAPDHDQLNLQAIYWFMDGAHKEFGLVMEHPYWRGLATLLSHGDKLPGLTLIAPRAWHRILTFRMIRLKGGELLPGHILVRVCHD